MALLIVIDLMNEIGSPGYTMPLRPKHIETYKLNCPIGLVSKIAA